MSTHFSDNVTQEFVRLLEDHGAEKVLDLLIRYADSVDDSAHKELTKDLKRAFHRYRASSDASG